MIGKQISHYRILEKIGEGGMGVVYKAEDTKLKRTVALKFLPPSLTRDPEIKQRFIHEARAASALEHPNICIVHEIDETDPAPGQPGGDIFIVMAYYDGESLKEKIKKGPLKIEELIDIAIQTAEGLVKAHDKDIVHRDIKPDNVLLTKDGVVKILDFGLAKVTGQTQLTKMGSTLGTVAYMSSEQTRGDAVDSRTDIWSLGVVLYEMITGQKPFKGDYEQAVSYSILNEDPKPITGLRTRVPMELDRIVDKMLKKDPSERYQHMSDLLVDLKALIKSSDSGIDISYSSNRTGQRHILNRLKPVFVGVALIIMVAAIVWYLLPKEAGAEITSLAVLPFENITDDPDQEYFAAGMTDQLITELSKIRSLRVASRNSAMQFKGKYQSLQEVAKTLNVEGIITATVFRSGERMRLNANLVRAADDRNIWNESYERKIEDVLNLTSTLAQSIASEISANLTRDEQKSLSEKRQVNPEAFDLVARGNFLISSSWAEENLERALEMMLKAVKIDPEYAQAHVGVAWAFTHLLSFGFRTGEDIYIQAKAAIDKALELDPKLGLPFTLHGRLLMAQNDIEGAKTAYLKAMELTPNDGLVRTLYSWILMVEGRYEEGIRQAEIAVELDPLSLFNRCNLQGWYYANQQYSEAKEEGNRILELNPQWLPAVDMERRIAAVENRLEDAVAAGKKYWLAMFSLQIPEGSTYQELLQWEAGTLEHMASEGNVLATYLVLCYAELGDKDKALKWLKIAEEKDEVVVHILFYPEFNSLREDPRFEAFVTKVHLPVKVYCNINSP